MPFGSARRIAVLSLAFAAIPITVRAQTGLESAIEQYTGTSIRGYLQPLADVLVANLSLGFVTSPSPSKKFSIGIEAVGMTAALDEQLRIYTASTPTGFQPATVQQPTIFGGKAQTVNHTSIPGLSYRGSDGLLDDEYFPTAAPQLRLGGIAGTDFVVRYTSSTMASYLEDEDFPELTLMGFGIQHSISQYFKLPIDLSVSAAYNSLKFGDIVDLSATSFGLNLGKSLGFLGLSVGAESDGGTMNLTYTSTDPVAPGTVDVDLEVERAVRFRGGASLNFGIIRLFGDAAFGDVVSYAAGFRIGF